MSMPNAICAIFATVAASMLICHVAQAESTTGLGFGQPITEEDLAGQFSIPPSGVGLPKGSGTVKQGEALYAERCSACHGDNLEGNPSPGIGGDRLIGGRGSLATDKPVKTVESYWPYATTLFDYIKRAMPFDDPGSLIDDEVYALTAYVLHRADLVKADATLDAESLPKIEMPNASGFISDPRPEHQLYR